jgi:acylphosphatase
MDPRTVRVRARVEGTVQGVFYRASTKDKAVELGVVGWVRNCSDGSVEISAEGNREAVDALINWARQGPPMAQVQALKVEEDVLISNPTELASSFEVRRTSG